MSLKAVGGFSMVELMMVVAIVAVLASVAIPKYQSYVQRSHVNASLSLARPMQLALTEYLNRHGELPPSSEALSGYGVSVDDKTNHTGVVESVRYTGGTQPAIEIHFRDHQTTPVALRGKFVALKTLLDANGILRFAVSEHSSIAEELRPRL